MSDNTFIEKLKAVRADALDILRQAGFIMSLQAGSPSVQIICDSISLSYQDDKVVFTVDGQDMTEMASAITILIRPGQYPVFNMSLWPKAIRTVNTPDEQLGIKLMPPRR